MKWLALLLLAPIPAMADPISVFVFLAEVGINTAAAAWIASNIVTIALTVGSVAVGNYQRRKAQQKARDAYNASLQDRLVMTATADGPRSRVYGRVRNCDGVLFKATRGANSEFYTLLIAVAGHEVDAIEDIYFNDELITLDGSGYVQTAPWLQSPAKSTVASFAVSGGAGSVTLPYTPISGSVSVTIAETGGGNTLVTPTVAGTLVSVSGVSNGTATVSYQYADTKSYARVRKYLGTSSQDLSADLVADFPALCTTNDKFKGIALLRVDLEYSQDAFPTGVPAVSAVVRGAKCYDPRSATTVWTQNPAIIIRDWVRYAYAGNTTSISDADVTAAANVCDVDASFTSPSGTVTMDAYQCGIVCRLDQDPSLALSEMVESMAGRWGWAGGTLRVVAGAYRAPVSTITEDWVSDASDIRISPTPPRSELVNSYRPTISNRDNKYQVEPAPPLTVATYVTADGQQLDAEITMGGVTSVQHAQHVAGVLLRDARQSLVIQLPCNLRALKLELFDTVNVTLSRFGWTAKLFEVMGWSFTLQGGVVLTLKEANATVYDVDASFSDLGDDDNSELPLPWDVPTITGLSVTSGTASLTDGSLISRTQVTWSAINDATVTQSGRVEVQFFEVGTSPGDDWPNQVEAGNASSTTINGLRAGYVYVFRARAVNSIGVRGRWSLQVAHMVSDPPWGTDVSLAASSGVALLGNAAQKTSAGGAWDEHVYSRDGYTGGAFASVVPQQNDKNVMFGLGLDPTFNQSYTSISYAAFLRNDGTIDAYLSGVGTSIGTAYSAGDVISMAYDGASVVYMKNGTAIFTTSAVAGLKCYFDSSFYDQNARLTNIRFGPMSAVTGIGTGQLAANAATKVNIDEHDFAGTGYGYSIGYTTARTFSVTPPFDCTIEFSATIEASGLSADAGRHLRWIVTASGADTRLGGAGTTLTDRQSFSCVNSFAATAGVQLDFQLQYRQPVFGGAAIYLYESSMRATEIRA